jgi:ABC-2 type transport system permease protein
MLFYATPILYPLGSEGPLKEHPSLEKLLMINPLAVIFEQVRVWVFAEPAAEAPTPAEAGGGALFLLIPAAIFVGICVLGVWVFTRQAPRIAEDL